MAPGFEPGMEALQASALPLGYATLEELLLTKGMKSVNMKFLPLSILITIVFLFYTFFGFNYLSWEGIRQFQQMIEISFFKAILIFISIYVVYAFTCIPGLLFLDVVAGIVFGQALGFLLAWLSAVTGALIVFLAVRYTVIDSPRKMNQPIVKRFQEGFNKHAANYLLFLRLVPCMPFGIVNISLGFLKVQPQSFIWTTLLGILPVSFFYTHAGAGIAHIINKEDPISIALLMNRYIVVSLIGLSLLALLPILIKKRNAG